MSKCKNCEKLEERIDILYLERETLAANSIKRMEELQDEIEQLKIIISMLQGEENENN